MKKRFISFMLCILIINLTYSAVASDIPTISLSNSECYPGETVEVHVSMQNNPGIVSMTLTVEYDETVLTLIEVSDTGVMPGQMHSAKKVSPYTLTWENDTSRENFYVNGDIAVLKFKVSENANAGNYALKLGYPRDGIFDFDVENIDFSLSHGSIAVRQMIPDKDIPTVEQHSHEMVYVPEITATCTEKGQLECWYCNGCNKYYMDQAGTVSVNSITSAVDPSNHVGTTSIINDKTATDESYGYTGDLLCNSCMNIIHRGERIPMLSEVEGSTEQWINPFADVNSNDKYYSAVQFVYEKGLFKGVSDNQFAPDTTMTRAMFVTVLGRLAGVDTMYFTSTSYDDVVAGEWYAPYVEWASQSGIVNGYGDGTFGVNDKITIEQAAVIMARYSEYIEHDTHTDIVLDHYSDSSEISTWAEGAMKWIVQEEIYLGEEYKLHPKNPAKRSLVAEILYLFVSKNTQ